MIVYVKTQKYQPEITGISKSLERLLDTTTNIQKSIVFLYTVNKQST